VIAINDGSQTKKVIPGTFEVQGYPSVLLFKNDKDQSLVEFDPEGPKVNEFPFTAAGLNSFIAKYAKAK
jgi:hypothetical protein